MNDAKTVDSYTMANRMGKNLKIMALLPYDMRILLFLLTQMKAAAPADQAGAAAFVSVTLHVFVDIPELKIWKLAIEQRW